jgi:hypothetical protein
MSEPVKPKGPSAIHSVNNQITFHPWVLFALFFLCNTLLSYFSLSPSLKFWLGALGLLVPFLLFCRDISTPRPTGPPSPGSPIRSKGDRLESHPLQDEFLPARWMNGGLFILGLALFLRFWDLTTLSIWPLQDEGTIGSVAQRLLEGGPVRWFYFDRHVPILTFLGLEAFFKILGVSLGSLWLYPAILSSVSLCLFAWASRRLFSQSFAFLFWLGLGLGFWPLLISRLVAVGNVMILWEGISLAVFSLYFKKAPGQPKMLEAGALGLAAGTGFYIYHAWAVAALCLGLAMAWACLQKTRKDYFLFFLFLSAMGVVFVPLALNLWHASDLSVYKQLWVFNGWYSCDFIFQNVSSNLCTLFWGRVPSTVFYYNPLWGGFFNPVLGSLIFLGGAELWRFRS